ncbi:hypothetical protein UZ36_00675 [Candidatus Nitromaritima sp. SCGC AAA799-C22]|nr:hypothetical protein UZ36_00675 [Candidatus Nitromaritima sp. SCGC AAA799-C22]
MPIFLAGALLLLSACGSPCDCEDKNAPLSSVKVSAIDGKEMVLVPAGEFIMGTDKTDEENTHRKIGSVKPLYLDQHPERTIHLDAYYIDRYEVTNEEYKRFLDASGYDEFPGHWENGTFAEGTAKHPVTQVTWREAWSYAMWARKTLPTEAQWEKAARGTDGRSFPWGNDFEKGKANIDIEGARAPVAVGSYPGDLSPYGAYDLAGNVMEWTLDWYRPYPGNNYKDKRFGKVLKVLRGTGFQKAGHYFLPAYRYAFARTEADPNEYFENVGFRCAAPVIHAE